MKKISLLSIIIFSSATILMAEDTDSKAGKSERNMMLNASTSSAPRELNIGLPESGNGAILFIDGTKHASGLPKSQYHWSGGNAYYKLGAMSLMESVIRTGEIGIIAISDTKLGDDKFQGIVTAGTSTNGLARLDAAVSGPLGKGWYYSGGLYVNMDPTGVSAPNRFFVDQKEIVQGSVSKRWSNASIAAIYRLSFCQDNAGYGYSYAPFIYNGDGTTSTYGDFRIGRDCYFPKADQLKYLENDTGKWITESMSKMDDKRIHDLAINASCLTSNGWDLKLNFHLGYSPKMDCVCMTPSGIDNAAAADGYTLPDGSAFSGPVQIRMATMTKMKMADYQVFLTADRNFEHHNLKTGAHLIAARQFMSESTTQFAHTVTANPERLSLNGEESWLFNTNANYFSANKFNLAAFCFDDFRIGSRIFNKVGLRVRYIDDYIECAGVTDGSDINKRVNGFNLADPTLCQITPYEHPGWDGAVSEHITLHLVDRLFFTTEGFWSLTNKATTYFKGANVPSLKAIGNAMVRGGLSYDRKWMDATLFVSYITSWNNAKVMSVTADVGGRSETIPWTAQYGIGTMGLTFDSNIYFGGFKLHTLVTWQDPRYKNYRNEFKFSDGSVKEIDYTGKYVTGISKWMVEFDPSYSWNKARVWTSIRYYSKQYASRNNLAYFDGHFETFAGMEYRVNASNKISLNIVNLFFQQGIEGSINTADTVEDAAFLKGLLMAGTYIRPFSIELSYTLAFGK